MFDKFKDVEKLKILVIGDIILDKYIHGRTDRISPEAPVPVVVSQSESFVLGGAANVSANLASLGASSYLVGFVGNDQSGEQIIALSKKKFNNVAGILKTDRPTTTKTRIIAKGQQVLRIDKEEDSFITQDQSNLIYNTVSALLDKENFSGIVLQDYNKGIFTIDLIQKLITKFQELNLPYFVDPKHLNFWKYSGATIFKPNFSELYKATEKEALSSFSDLMLACAQKLNCKILMCTLASDGIAYVEDNALHQSPTEKIAVLDVSGAGDSALAGIVLAYLLGYDTKEIATIANYCGKVVCLKSGVSTITIDELISSQSSILEDTETIKTH